MFKTSVLIGSLLGGVAAQSSAPVLSAGDGVRGKAVYARCLGCHSPERHRTGPKHCGLLGRKSGTAQGFEYSDAMRQADVVWNEQTLDRFLFSPLAYMPGTSMGIAGIKDDAERQDLIAYLVVINGQKECN